MISKQLSLSVAFALTALLGALCVAASPVAAEQPADAPTTYERPPFELSVRKVVPPELLEGESYRVVGPVENDGFMNHYTIESDFGTFLVSGDVELRLRVREIEVLGRLDQVTRTDAFVEALGRAALAPVGSAVQVVTHPVGTVERLPGGVAAYFARAARQAKALAGQVAEVHRALGAEKTDESGEAEVAAESEEEPAPDWMERGVDQAVAYAREKSGYERERREYARRFGVSPYSGNEVLDDALDRVAKAAALGGFSVQYLGLPEGNALETVERVHELAWELGAVDLRDRNRRLLRKRLGLSDQDLQLLFENPNLTPDLLTALVDALVGLEGVEGRERFVALTVEVRSTAMAAFLVRTADFFARYQERVGPAERVKRFDVGPAVPVGVTGEGDVVAALAVDRLAWTRTLAELAIPRTAALREETPGGRLLLFVEGGVSPRAGEELEQLGWIVRSKAFEGP